MAAFPILGPGATLAERQAAASFMLLCKTLPFFRRGLVINDEGWSMVIEQTIRCVGQGDGDDAALVRQTLEGMRPNLDG